MPTTSSRQGGGVFTGTVGVTVGVTGRLTPGLTLDGSGVVTLTDGFTVGLSLGFTDGLVVDGSAGGAILIGTEVAGACVRGGEVRRGVGEGVALGLGGGTEGLTEAGGLTASGGSEPGGPGRSAMTPPPNATAAVATATATL